MIAIVLIILAFIMYTRRQYVPLVAIALLICSIVMFSGRFYLRESFSDIYNKEEKNEIKNMFSFYDKQDEGTLTEKQAKNYKKAIRSRLNIPLQTATATRRFDDIYQEIQTSEQKRRDPKKCYLLNSHSAKCDQSQNCIYSNNKNECVPKPKQSVFQIIKERAARLFSKKMEKEQEVGMILFI